MLELEYVNIGDICFIQYGIEVWWYGVQVFVNDNGLIVLGFQCDQVQYVLLGEGYVGFGIGFFFLWYQLQVV